MSDWKGLHNPERHYEGFVYPVLCRNCGQDCRLDRYCRCCLETEVERLRATVNAALAECAHQRSLIPDYDDNFDEGYGDGVEHVVTLIEKALGGDR